MRLPRGVAYRYQRRIQEGVKFRRAFESCRQFEAYPVLYPPISGPAFGDPDQTKTVVADVYAYHGGFLKRDEGGGGQLETARFFIRNSCGIGNSRRPDPFLLRMTLRSFSVEVISLGRAIRNSCSSLFPTCLIQFPSRYAKNHLMIIPFPKPYLHDRGGRWRRKSNPSYSWMPCFISLYRLSRCFATSI